MRQDPLKRTVPFDAETDFLFKVKTSRCLQLGVGLFVCAAFSDASTKFGLCVPVLLIHVAQAEFIEIAVACAGLRTSRCLQLGVCSTVVGESTYTEDSFELVDSSEDGTLVARWSRIRELRSLVRFGATGSFETDCAV